MVTRMVIMKYGISWVAPSAVTAIKKDLLVHFERVLESVMFKSVDVNSNQQIWQDSS